MRPVVVNQSWILINFARCRTKRKLFPPTSKCVNLSFSRFTQMFRHYLKNHDKILATRIWVLNRHFDMQKLIPQTQLLMCRIQFKKKRQKDGRQEGKHLSPAGVPLSLELWSKGSDATDSVMWLAQFCTRLLHHLLIFVNQPWGCAEDGAERRTAYIVLGECMVSGGYRRDGQAYW